MTALNELNKISVANDLEAFELIKEHMLSMPEKSMDDSESCAYRGSIFSEDYEEYKYNGNACAVGALIKDDVYNIFSIEGSVVEWPADLNIVLDCVAMSHPDWTITEKSFIILRTFQNIHDRNDIETWSQLIDVFESNIVFDNDGNVDHFHGSFQEALSKINGVSYRDFSDGVDVAINDMLNTFYGR